MAQVVSSHIWYPEGYPGSCYDLRQVTTWSVLSTDTDRVDVRFAGDTLFIIEFDRTDFEVAKAASLADGG